MCDQDETFNINSGQVVNDDYMDGYIEPVNLLMTQNNLLPFARALIILVKFTFFPCLLLKKGTLQQNNKSNDYFM